jgi:hypothetical protein
MARDEKKGKDDEEIEDKDAPVSDEALELLDEDEEDELDLGPDSDDDKGWE